MGGARHGSVKLDVREGIPSSTNNKIDYIRMVWEKNCSELFFTPHRSSRAGKLHFSEQLKTAPFKPYIVAEVAFAYGEVDVELAILAVVWREMHADRPVGGVRKNRKNREILFGQRESRD